MNIKFDFTYLLNLKPVNMRNNTGQESVNMCITKTFREYANLFVYLLKFLACAFIDFPHLL